MKDLIPIEAIQERDIDLLLLEELHSSKAFRSWFVKNTIGNEKLCGSFIDAWHSLNHTNLGESDLILKFSGPNKNGYFFLIENKIDASFQPKQALRYKNRGEEYVREGECEDFKTILVAPKAYITNEECFDYIIEYEKIKDWYIKQKSLRERGRYKAGLLKLAIEKSRRGYRPIRDEKTASFWKKYWRLANRISPELGMKEPKDDIPIGSSFIIFKPKGMKRGLSLVHKTEKGFADLELSGKGSMLNSLTKEYSHLLGKRMSVEKAYKSAVIRIHVDKLNMQKDFNYQKDAIVKALKALKQLNVWAKRNITDVQ